jgi:hypothetical protein
MANSLTGDQIRNSYDQLLHINGGPTSSEKNVYSGTGVVTALKIGTGSVSVNNIKLDSNTIATTDTNGNLVLSPNGTGEIHVTGKLGYSSGGGTVTQATSKTTAVTLNAKSGQITMHNGALADDATAAFTLTNSFIGQYDVVIINVASVGTVGAYQLTVGAVAAGSCSISVLNVSGGSLSQAIRLNFAIIKGIAT